MHKPMKLAIWSIFIGLTLIFGLIAFSAQSTAAQGASLQLEKTLLKDSPIVKVGETLTFAITITNNWNTTVITLPLIDEYDQSVLEFVDATPAQDDHVAATGVISWDNILQTTGPLSPGEQLVVYVRFVATHPSPRVVNRAYTHDAFDYLGNAVDDGADEDDSIAEGGRTPLTKTLALGTASVGEIITFNITISNDGAARILEMPVQDRFDATVLQFVRSEPPIDAENAGTLVWSNVLRPPLPTMLEPQQTVVLTVSFLVIGDPQLTSNEAEVMGATDSFGNNLAPAADDVPIQIIPNQTTPTVTFTPLPASTVIPVPATNVPGVPTAVAATPGTQPTDESPAATPETQPTDESPAATATVVLPDEIDAGGDQGGPVSLPDTGSRSGSLVWLMLILAFVVSGLWLRRRSILGAQ